MDTAEVNQPRDKELSATEIVEKIGISSANDSQHLAIMRNKGILKSRREGVSIHYSLANQKVITACDIMREVLFEYLNEKQSLAEKNQVLKEGLSLTIFQRSSLPSIMPLLLKPSAKMPRNITQK